MNQLNFIERIEQTQNPTAMIIYNITTKVHSAIATDWLQWMQTEHIPEVMATGCFSEFKIVRLLEVDESEGATYAVQYHAADLETLQRYRQQHAPALAAAAFDRWGDGFISFRSVMQVIS